ncbi:hypothetical protein APR12_002724 [Nocardia amikacinitolerans]|uniref:DUF6086 family protein n=2 Tax=Nocardia amikacinitolerans TaxID=756689 RepID=UPI000ABF5198|nr:DUF6086 family protein [Nocardia amikacinitolerans]MCP2317378.1 hypothetical protein [Nocardia amikacinitolerans]
MMSYAFEVGDRTVWSPSLRVGDLFVRMYTDTCSVLGTSTGLTAIASDMYEIDIEVFERATSVVFNEYSSSQNATFKAMLGATLGPAVNILNYCQRPLIPKSSEESAFISWANSLSMPR